MQLLSMTKPLHGSICVAETHKCTQRCNFLWNNCMSGVALREFKNKSPTQCKFPGADAAVLAWLVLKYVGEFSRAEVSLKEGIFVLKTWGKHPLPLWGNLDPNKLNY